MSREELLGYIAWNERMIVEFTEMEKREDTWPMELRDCNYHDSVIRCKNHLADLQKQLDSENYDPVIMPSAENENAETEWDGRDIAGR